MHHFDLSHQTAIVTGAGRGLGAAMAKGLAAYGARVVIGDLDLPAAQATAAAIQQAGGEAIAVQADITQQSSGEALVQTAVEQWGAVNILVNNAGIDIIQPALEIDQSAWDRVLAVDLKGQFLCAQTAARQMVQQGSGGSIIFISSIASTVGIRNLAAYSAAKGGINQLVRVMALEWASYQIRVNAIAPGYFANIMQGATAEHDNLEKQQQIHIFTPMQRRGQPEELVGPVVFLAAAASSYVTGAILSVDGGYTAI